MNAIPSDLGVGPGGAPGPSSRKDLAIASGSANGRFFQSVPSREERESSGSLFVGSQSAMMAGCWALDARPAQGRVGGVSRHIAYPLVIHLLLSDEASGRTVSPPVVFAHFVRLTMRNRDPLDARRTVRTTVRPPRHGRDSGLDKTSGGELARFACCREPSRVKGVRSA